MGYMKSGTRRPGFRGFGLFPGDDGCPDGTSRFGIPGGACVAFAPASSGAQCPPGQTAIPDPFGSGVFFCAPSGTPTPAPAGSCPDGQIGLPPLVPCMAIPGATPSAIPPTGASPCPSGQIGFPPLVPCIPVPGQPQAAPSTGTSQCPSGSIGWPSLGIPCRLVGGAGPLPGVPGPVPSAPPPPPATPPPQQANIAATGPGLPTWAAPAAIGAGVLGVLYFMSRRRKG